MYGTELVVVYVDFSVRVDVLISVIVVGFTVVRVWSMVIVVGWVYVVLDPSQP